MARWVIISWYLCPISLWCLSLLLYDDVRELIALGALDDVVEYQDGAVVGRLEDEDVLVLALLVVEHLVDLERHGLAGPHVGDLAEPAI
jgi:hypothetical protein